MSSQADFTRGVATILANQIVDLRVRLSRAEGGIAELLAAWDAFPDWRVMTKEGFGRLSDAVEVIRAAYTRPEKVKGDRLAPSQAALDLCVRIRERYKAPGNEHVLELEDAAREIDRFACRGDTRPEKD